MTASRPLCTEFFRTSHPEILQEIREKGELTDELAKKIVEGDFIDRIQGTAVG